MFGPALSGPYRLVNRDVPVADELAYKAVGYQRGSIREEVVAEVAVEPIAVVEDKPTPRKGKGQK